MKRSIGAFAGLLLLGSLPLSQTAAAEEVTLKTRDGAFEITGDLVEFDGGFYTIRSTMGVVRVPAGQVDCTGPGCPAGDAAGADDGATQSTDTDAGADGSAVALVLGAGAPGRLVPALLDAYGARDGVTVSAGPDGASYGIESEAGAFRLTMGAGGAGMRVMIGFDAGTGALRGGYRQVLALDPIVAVAAPGNRPTGLSLPEIGRIFGGRLRGWGELETRGGAIVPVLPANDPVVESAVTAIILDAGARSLSDGVFRADDIPAFLLTNAGSVAMMRNSERGALRATPLAGECGLSARPDEFAVKSGQYPLVRPLVLAAPSSDLPAGFLAFIDFAVSADGQAAIAGTGLFGQSIVEADDDRQADWISSAVKLSEFVGANAVNAALFEELIESTRDAKRLSVTLRHVFDGGGMTAAARGDLARLATAIEDGDFDGREIVFIGFTDAASAAAGGRVRSENAAAQALRELLAAHPVLRIQQNVRFSSAGFGGIAPLVCESARAERAVNRRVEVWVRRL